MDDSSGTRCFNGYKVRRKKMVDKTETETEAEAEAEGAESHYSCFGGVFNLGTVNQMGK